MTIKHIVLSGGAYKGFYMVGALDYLQKKNFYNINDIESIYGTSVGSIIGLALCLKIPLEDLKKYIINKDWKQYFNFSLNKILNIYEKKGFIDKSFIIGIFKSLFRGVGLSITSTLKDIYDFSKVDLYIFTTNLTKFKLETLSHKTHPNLSVIDAIYMSSSIPFIFQPNILSNDTYVDGGIINPYPLNICLEHLKKNDSDINFKEILGFKILKDSLENINKNSSIFHFGLYLIYKLLDSNYNYTTKEIIPYELVIPTTHLNLKQIRNIINLDNERKRLIDEGENYGKLFLNYINV